MDINSAALAFDALSKPVRIQIFQILVEHCDSGITPTEIARLMNGMQRNTLSFHLSLLSQAGLCKSEKKGKCIIYKPKGCHLRAVADFLIKDCCPKNA